ncbi:hypothetical protein HNP52_003713 [Sphingomonas kyeonggiensis]|uniref:Uncharacterized protein n=1 Tax=Sphingomonas kyeonggiensis TaxID=1268553 RepID=A0A7W7K4T6_9SPHN|nr:hypothetical protein [Sphingomonas kyeonggiensis]MBB4840621.1 hypothetical protein [Sphingomonas kyeonggiensis]
MIVDWKVDLVKEKSLWQVYRASTKLTKSKFNQYTYLVLFVINGFISANWAINVQCDQAYKAVLLASDIGFNLSVQILGFLIGGFAIFATVTDHKLMIKLATVPMGGEGISVFKNVFFNFLSVFYIFLITLSVSVVVKIVGGVELFKININFSSDGLNIIKTLVNCFSFFIVSGLVAFSIIRLKSFIWNIYQAFITFLAVSELMDKEKERKLRRCRPLRKKYGFPRR